MSDQARIIDCQGILSRFGDFVLDHDDLDDILNEGCRLVASALGADLAKVIEIDRQNGTGFVRAGFGWNDGIVGEARVELGGRSSEAYAIEKTIPVISNDIASEDRFTFPSFLKDHGVVALINVPILLPGRVPYGILQVDAREAREFDQQDVDFLKTYAMVLGPVIDRLKTVAELRVSDERLRLLVDSARAYVMIISDRDGRVTDWLGGSEEILGWTAHEAIGQKADMIFTEADRAAGVPERELSTAREKGSVADVRWHRRKDGTPVFLNGQTIALRERSGKLRGYYKIGQDHTDRQRNDERQSFLSDLSDALRPLNSVRDIADCAAQRLAAYLDVSRVIYGRVRDDMLEVLLDRTNHVPSLVGEHTLAPLGPAFLSAYRSGAIVKVSDVAEDGGLSSTARASLLGRQVAAFVDLVVVDDRFGTSFLGVQNSTPRAWTSAEVNLLREIGDRVRSEIERARAEQARQESEARLQRFGEASSNVLWSRDAHSLRWNYLSQAFESVFGVKADQALAEDGSQSSMDFLVEEDRQDVIRALSNVAAGEARNLEYRIQRPDGQIRWLRDSVFPIAGSDGRISRIGGIAQDVTEIRQAQTQIEQSEERLRLSVEVGGLGLWDWNVETGEIHWSDRHFEMEGYEVGEVPPSYAAWAERVHPDDRAAAETALQASMETGEEFDHEFRTLHPDGETHWLEGRGRFFYDDKNNPIRMIGSMVETTERRAWEERQKILIAELQHRTRNLIAVVRSMADKTARSSFDLDDFRARFRDRLDALARVQGLLSRLTDVDRVAFDDLLHTELSAMGAAAERLTLDGPSNVRLRSSTVQTLAMALHELATNAVKYGAIGQQDAHLTVRWSLEQEGLGNKPWLHIDWKESGVKQVSASDVPFGTGQGRELIEKALPYQLSAKTTYQLEPDGVHCTISIPTSSAGGRAGG